MSDKPTVPFGPKHPPRSPNKHRPLTPVAGRNNCDYLNEGEKLALAMTAMRERPARSLESIARDVGLSGESLAIRAFAFDEDAFRDHMHAVKNPQPGVVIKYEPLAPGRIIKLNMDGSPKCTPNS